MELNLEEHEVPAQNEKPLITIVGVLGKQGRSTARTLLDSGRYCVRGITRRMDSPEAIRLIEQGAELVSIPLDVGYQQDYEKAFRGSHGVFMMTPSIVPPQTHEFELGKQLADAAVEAGAKHIIFSSLENVDQITNGEKFAPHFTDKAEVEAYIRTFPVTSSFIYMAFFFTNLIEFYTPKLLGDTLVFPIYLPKDFRAPFVDPLTATGPAVLEIFSNPKRYSGISMPVIGDLISPQEMVDTFTRVTGRKAVYSSAFTREDFLYHFPDFASNEPLLREVLGMAEYAVEYGYFGKDRDWLWSQRMNPDSLNWENFLRTTGWQGEKLSY
ncbi:Nucleoside-diphosphate-sugar epimerase [Mucilaginibacter pineti]|uniref:Nucleoside-diphosphate-sugar epimerase n=1 Tax=Mucilaginibacter pineti TaxID=1391627 RepID=A0A1G7GGC7_9SPHI|nr:NmrA/HSCARG family protein [Mucilaginibacter pineti]SDE87166.1 Nucleoside-diphosphate-sugar epimerase [Mucilaginibacter pineti]